MKIHFIHPDDGWILTKIAKQWDLPGRTLGTRPDPKADINFYINYALWVCCKFARGNYLNVGLFTHRQDAHWQKCAQGMDWCVAMCSRSAKLLPAEKTTVIKPAIAEQFNLGRPIRIGIASTAQMRKRTDWIPKLRKLDGFEIRWTNSTIPVMPDS